MDGQNINNGQNQSDEARYSGSQYNSGQYNSNQYNSHQNNYYQDNTANPYFQQPHMEDVSDNKASGVQVASMVFGILAILFSCCYGVGGIVFGIIGLILAVLGRNDGKNGIKIAGLICSIVGLILGVIVLGLLILGLSLFYDMFRNNPDILNHPEILNDPDALIRLLIEYYGNM